MYGTTQFGQLGIGFTNKKSINIPQNVDSRVQFVKITCGAGHCVALSELGKLYSWGLNVLG
jgi:alpha-tubulin suppressor-like RCC1 family protein